MESREELVKAGLTEGESKVYLALLALGPSTTGSIVGRSGVAYSNVYEILRRLMNKGLASFVVKNKTKHFQAANPANLLELLEKKENDIERQREALARLLPRLKAMQEEKPEQEAEIFIGIKGLRTAYLKLRSGHDKSEWLFFYIHQKEYADESDKFYASISKWFRKSGQRMRGISNMQYRGSKHIKKSKFMEVRYAGFPIPANIDICDDEILIVSWGASPVAFLIKSKEIAASLKEYFEDAWKMAEK